MFFKLSLLLFLTVPVLTDNSDDASLINAHLLSHNDLELGPDCGCTVLRGIFSEFPSKLLFPGKSNYTSEATHYYDLRSDLSPKCIFVPTCANDVAKAVVVLNACQATFAVRGGGHMPVPGAANTNGGILIALSAFTDIKVAKDLKSVDAGPALNWYQLNAALDPYGLIVIGGRLKTIGIAGLTIGGGISYFSAKYGFAMDNVIAYEIVTASGRIVTASAHSEPDLFWAMKGFGSSFGIVTKFTFAAYSIPKISTTLGFFTEDMIPQFIGAATSMANYQEDYDTAAGSILTIITTPSTGAVNPSLIGVQAETAPATVFSNFTSIPGVVSSFNNNTTLAEWTLNLDTPFQQFRCTFGTHSVSADNATVNAMYKTFSEALPSLSHIQNLTVVFVMQPITKSTTTVGKTNGIGNTWNVDNSEAYIWWLITATWTNAEDDNEVLTWADTVRESIHATNLANGKGQNIIYMNDASDSQRLAAAASIPPANLARLKDIRQKYDPNLVFTKLNSGGYKLD